MNQHYRRLSSFVQKLTAGYAWEKPIGDEQGAAAVRIWGMKMISRTLALALLATSLWISNSSARAGELIYSQYSDGQSGFGPSQLWAPTGVNSEIADEFNVVGSIDGVFARGFAGVTTVNYQGVWIRFYAFGADNKPGALQHEYFLAVGDPNVVFNGGEINATLSPAFVATGRHFLSVQPVCNYWYPWSSSGGAPRGEAFYFRDNTAGEGWHHGDGLNTNVNADVEFSLYGTVTGAGTITSLSARHAATKRLSRNLRKQFWRQRHCPDRRDCRTGFDLDQHARYRLCAGKCPTLDASGASG